MSKTFIPKFKFELGKGPTKAEWEASQKAIQEEQARLGAAYNRLRAHPAMKAFPRGSVVSGNLIPLLIRLVRQAAFPLPQSITLPLALDWLKDHQRAENAGFDALEEIAVPLLKAQYEEEIEAWDWEAAYQEAKYNLEDDLFGEDGVKMGLSFLGTVFLIYPSGKYWNLFASNNVDDDERLADVAFAEALNAVATRHGAWVESGDGDPCDLYLAWNIYDQD